MSQLSPPERDMGKVLGGVLLIIVAGIYLLNPTAGVFELLPDNLPLVGNMDEAAAAALVIWGFTLVRRGMNIPSPDDAAAERVIDVEPTQPPQSALPSDPRTPE